MKNIVLCALLLQAFVVFAQSDTSSIEFSNQQFDNRSYKEILQFADSNAIALKNQLNGIEKKLKVLEQSTVDTMYLKTAQEDYSKLKETFLQIESMTSQLHLAFKELNSNRFEVAYRSIKVNIWSFVGKEMKWTKKYGEN